MSDTIQDESPLETRKRCWRTMLVGAPILDLAFDSEGNPTKLQVDTGKLGKIWITAIASKVSVEITWTATVQPSQVQGFHDAFTGNA